MDKEQHSSEILAHLPDKLGKDYPWLPLLAPVASGLLRDLYIKEEAYAGSWQKRGGVGAYMMTARKTDRIEEIVKRHGYDVFSALGSNDADVMDDVRDLVSYWLLILAEIQRRATVAAA